MNKKVYLNYHSIPFKFNVPTNFQMIKLVSIHLYILQKYTIIDIIYFVSLFLNNTTFNKRSLKIQLAFIRYYAPFTFV